MPHVIELFAGAGGSALGLERAGFSHLACIEDDPDACETLRAAGLPCVEGDVRDPDLYESEWVGCDLLWSSFPCQCWSSAGKREGAKDERNMWPATVDAVDRLEPQWFAAENVKGLLQHRGGCQGSCLGPEECPRAYFDLVILAQLRERFPVVQYRVLNASSFGVPQHRRRVFIVAGPRPIQWPEPTHRKPSGQGDLFGSSLLPWATVGEALGDFRRAEIPTTRVIGGGTNPRSPGEAHLRTYRDLTDEPCTTITAEQIGNAGPWVESGKMRPGLLNRPSPTVSAVGECKGSGPGGHPEKMQRASDALFLATGRRRLTIEECATLQDFPADHPFKGTKGSRYKQVGNAVPPKLSEVVGLAIKRAQKENE